MCCQGDVSNFKQQKMNEQVKQIGNYTYNERFCLGEGSFGKVFEGSSKNGKRVAIKKVDKKLINSDQYLRQAIQTEITILKKFNHPNIVKLQDVVLTANSIYVITELCRNGDLKGFMRIKRPTQDQCTKILIQIINGMRQIVKQGIIHRDLKPANVLVNDGVFKICDFGFAKYFKEIGKMNRTCVGTPMYMSPQALKHKPYTNKSDVWSLGIVFYEMLFNKTPWLGNAEDELYRNINSKPLYIPSCSKWSTTILKGMLEVEEANRWGWERVFEFVDKPGDFAEMAEKPSLFYQQQSGPTNGFQFNQLKLVKQPSHEPSSPARQAPPSQRQPLANVQQPKPYAQQSSSIPPSDVRQSWQQNYFFAEQVKVDPNASRSRNGIFSKAQPKMKAKNMLAYFQEDKASQDPRFCYFIFVELSLTPLKTQSFEIFLSSLYDHTIQHFSHAIQQQKPSPYRDLLITQLEEVKEIEVRKIPTQLPVRQLAQMVYNESDKYANMSKEWVKRFIDHKYYYEPI